MENVGQPNKKSLKMYASCNILDWLYIFYKFYIEIYDYLVEVEPPYASNDLDKVDFVVWILPTMQLNNLEQIFSLTWIFCQRIGIVWHKFDASFSCVITN